jgi:biotin--protein ligase
MVGTASSVKHIYCYCDEGVDQECLDECIRQWSPFSTCTKISARELVTTLWMKRADLFVMPGGRDLPYVEALNGRGVQIIHDYVSSGGKFLGICAGAYFASSYVEFDKGGDLEVLGERALKFFPGKAIGPAFFPFKYNSEAGAKVLPLSYNSTFEQFSAYSFYNGGCFFEPSPSSQYRVLATYEDGRAAIVTCSVLQGTALLSGVHFELPLRDGIQEQSRQRLMEALFEQLQ